MRRLPLTLALALVAAPGLAGCDRREPADVKPWVRPAPRKADGDPSCAGIAAARPTATWQRGAASLDLAAAGPVVVSDPSALGGPFHAPVVVNDVPAGAHAVDVLTGPTRGGAGRPLCVVVHLRDGEATSWAPIGDVPVDTEVVAIADHRRFEAAARSVLGTIVAGVQAEAPELPSVVRELTAAGIPVEQVLPTLATTTRPVQPGDKAAIGAALRRAKAYGHYVEEPATTGWLFVRALGDKSIARVDLADAKGVAVAVEAGEGDGAYVVAVGTVAGTPVAFELRLTP